MEISQTKIRQYLRKQVFPGSAMVQNSPANVADSRDLDLISRSGRSLEEEVETTPIFLPAKFHGQRRPAGSGDQQDPWGRKWRQLQYTCQGNSMDKETMQPMELQKKVRHDRVHTHQS